MASHVEILDRLLAQLRSKMSGSIELRVLKREDDRIAIQVGAKSEALLGVRIKDPLRPSFQVTYPKLTAKKDGSKHVEDIDAEGVVAGGVEWIVSQLAEHGVVMPEFVD